MNHQRKRSAAEMDFPVEATVHLNLFRNKSEVRKILQSHGFEELTGLGKGEVRVRGHFSQLGAVKVLLENLLESKSDPAAASGTISSYYKDTSTRGRSLHRDRLASPTSPTASREDILVDHRSNGPKQLVSSPPQQGTSLGRALESLVVETDVFMYADRVRKDDIRSILTRYNVHLKKDEDEDSTTIILTGKDSKMAAGEMRRFLEDLRIHLRTQEVPRKKMNRDSYSLLDQIRKRSYVYDSVFVCELPGGLHLIGPSRESFDLQQRLLGNVSNKPRKTDKLRRPQRFNFFTSLFQRNTKGQSAAAPAAAAAAAPAAAAAAAYDDPSLGGAAGYSSLKYHRGEKEHERAPAVAQNVVLRRRRSEYSQRKSWPQMSRPTQETPITSPPPVSLRQSMKLSFSRQKKSFMEKFDSLKPKK